NTVIQTGTTEEVPSAIVREFLPLPEIGRCVIAESAVLGKTTGYKGAYSTVGCTSENSAHEGKYEWLAGTGAGNKFSGTNKKLTLETVGKTTVTCSAGSNEGEYTGPK